jgi:hypothetical protein
LYCSQSKEHTTEKIFSMDIKEVAEEFVKMQGNEMFSPQLFVNFFEFAQEKLSLEDPYEQIAKICNLKETGTPGCYTQLEGVGYYTKTKFGFIDIRSNIKQQ